MKNLKKFNIRMLLAFLLVCCGYNVLAEDYLASSVEFKSRFPINNLEKRRNLNINKRSVKNSKDEIEEHERNRRQSFCDYQLPCPPNPYRTINGTCNNLVHTNWGSTSQPFFRFLPPRYEDGNQAPRGHNRVTNQLPNSRVVSVAMTNTIIPAKPEPITGMVMQYGQFLDHDLTLTANDGDSSGIYASSSCCDDFKTATIGSPSCMPIKVANDGFYKNFNVTCLPFVRSSNSFCWNYREQFNKVPSYLDANQIYGSDVATQTQLREPNSWKLKVSPGKECNSTCPLTFLPIRFNFNNQRDEFFAGDGRVEQQPGLTSMHTIFVRAHNDFGQMLKNDNPTWTNDKIYEEARKIIWALNQQFTYDEFLPIVIGPTLMAAKGLTLVNVTAPDPFFKGYDAEVDATLANVLATSCFRFGHSLIPLRFNLSGVVVNLSDTFNNHNVTKMSGKFPSQFTKGICNQPSEEMDHIISPSVQSFLLAKAPFQFGSDLYARNIERGRDHGLPPYIEWLNSCRSFSEKISYFHQLYKVMPNETVNTLRQLYNDKLTEVDLFPAAIAEYNLKDGLVGPTFGCLIQEQFYRLKVGDRFWFENPNVLSKEQLKAIRSTTLSMLFCKNTDISDLQQKVMLPPSASNPKISCLQQKLKGIYANFTINW